MGLSPICWIYVRHGWPGGLLQPLGACLSVRRATAQASAPWAGVWLSYRGTWTELCEDDWLCQWLLTGQNAMWQQHLLWGRTNEYPGFCLFLVMFLDFLCLYWIGSREFDRKAWGLERVEQDRQRTLSWESNSGCQRRSCAIYRGYRCRRICFDADSTCETTVALWCLTIEESISLGTVQEDLY